jgi:hypothetical protein
VAKWGGDVAMDSHAGGSMFCFAEESLRQLLSDRG